MSSPGPKVTSLIIRSVGAESAQALGAVCCADTWHTPKELRKAAPSTTAAYHRERIDHMRSRRAMRDDASYMTGICTTAQRPRLGRERMAGRLQGAPDRNDLILTHG